MALGFQPNDDDPRVSPERRLMMAVILNALSDALGYSADSWRPEQRKGFQRQARAWFVEAGDDFRIVCEHAGFDPGQVRREVLDILNARVLADEGQNDLPPGDLARIAAQAGLPVRTANNVLRRKGLPNFLVNARVLRAYSQLAARRAS